jgi:hypothetical protein
MHHLCQGLHTPVFSQPQPAELQGDNYLKGAEQGFVYRQPEWL